jgi:hypothetical protein
LITFSLAHFAFGKQKRNKILLVSENEMMQWRFGGQAAQYGQDAIDRRATGRRPRRHDALSHQTSINKAA